MKALKKVSVHEAKTHFSKIIAQVIAGQEVIVTKSGKPIVKIISLQPLAKRPKGGCDFGKVKICESFFDSLPESILEDF